MRPEGPGRSEGRPQDDDVVAIDEALRRQRGYVMAAGAPVAAMILDAVAGDVAAGGPLADLLPARARFGDFPGIRVMAAVHLLALRRKAPMVALRLPTLGGVAPRSGSERAAFEADVVSLLAGHPDDLLAGLQRTPQTNEPGRAALLRCALSRLDPRLPVRLTELGASAGLNLRADLLPGIAGMEAGPLPAIIERSGCDLDPVDASATSGRDLLTSYVWVDDVHRFERLRHALDVAERVPASVVRQDAASFCAGLELTAATTTVIWHSAMWVYLDASTRAKVLRSIADLGATSTADSTLAHVSWEWPSYDDEPGAPFALVVRRWRGRPDDGVPRLLARGTSHGSSAHLVSAADSGAGAG
jgi:hypothetical protein